LLLLLLLLLPLLLLLLLRRRAAPFFDALSFPFSRRECFLPFFLPSNFFFFRPRRQARFRPRECAPAPAQRRAALSDSKVQKGLLGAFPDNG